MLKDITIGQFFPGNSLIHRLDPRFKIIATILFIVMLFSGDSLLCLGIGAFFTVMIVLMTKIPLKMYAKSIKPLLPFLVSSRSIASVRVIGEVVYVSTELPTIRSTILTIMNMLRFTPSSVIFRNFHFQSTR